MKALPLIAGLLLFRAKRTLVGGGIASEGKRNPEREPARRAQLVETLDSVQHTKPYIRSTP